MTLRGRLELKAKRPRRPCCLLSHFSESGGLAIADGRPAYSPTIPAALERHAKKTQSRRRRAAGASSGQYSRTRAAAHSKKEAKGVKYASGAIVSRDSP
jgi:hypothetical protein